MSANVSEVVPQTRRGSLTPGTQIGRYELLRRLARGGMAELYLARASGLHGFEKLCVLKLVLPHLVEDRRFVQMFLHEARMAATLDHPNIAHVTDIGEVEGEPFFVMQYVRGRDLRKIAKSLRGAPLPLDVALTVASQVAAGLHYVHERRGPEGKPLGLVHRDVSPANVMIGFDGDVKLVDFGIAKSAEQADATRTGVIKGKVSYMAPEQCRGDVVDGRTDVFALGILLAEMTTGRRLFRGETDFAIMSKIVEGVFTPPRELRPEYPEALNDIVLRALKTDPADRYPTAAEMQSDLEVFAQNEGLRLSTLTLSSFMREVYGEQSNAMGIDPLDEAPTEIRPDPAENSLPLTHASARPTLVESENDAPAIEPPETGTETVALPEEPKPEAGTIDASPESRVETVVAEVPLPPQSTTVVVQMPVVDLTEISSPAVPIERFATYEVDDEPAPANNGRLASVIAIAVALVVGIVVFAVRGDATNDDDPAAPAVGEAQPAPAIAPEPDTRPRAEPVVEDNATPAIPTTPIPTRETRLAEPDDVSTKPGTRATKGSRPHKRTNAKSSRTKAKRGRPLDDMYPSG